MLGRELVNSDKEAKELENELIDSCRMFHDYFLEEMETSNQETLDTATTTFVKSKLNEIVEENKLAASSIDKLTISSNAKLDRLTETVKTTSETVDRTSLNVDRLSESVDRLSKSSNATLDRLSESVDRLSKSSNATLDRLSETVDRLSSNVNSNAKSIRFLQNNCDNDASNLEKKLHSSLISHLTSLGHEIIEARSNFKLVKKDGSDLCELDSFIESMISDTRYFIVQEVKTTPNLKDVITFYERVVKVINLRKELFPSTPSTVLKAKAIWTRQINLFKMADLKDCDNLINHFIFILSSTFIDSKIKEEIVSKKEMYLTDELLESKFTVEIWTIQCVDDELQVVKY